jgi:RecF/RecN/SMC N terminal domain
MLGNDGYVVATWKTRIGHVVFTWSRRYIATCLEGGQRGVCKTVKMRIEELILEGFKSYPVRTQITGWDPSFNAITGLNGSGKSNILDAICFVLGLTNMSSVRTPHDRDFFFFSFSFLLSDARTESARSHL